MATPQWELRRVCPCCGQGALVFSDCPKCSHVVLICDDDGTVYPDPHDLTRTLAQSYTDGPKCSVCDSASVLDFGHATSGQIQALGFTPDDYY